MVHTGESTTGEGETVMTAAAITGFKGGGSRPRRATKGARSGLKNHRTQQPDTNIWKQLLEKRHGYFFAARVLGRILDWARRHQKQEVGENRSETTEQRAILELFRAEKTLLKQQAKEGQEGHQVPFKLWNMKE